MVTGSKELIRDINSHLVLEAIVNYGPISRAELSKRLGLTKATISAIVQVLLDGQLIIEIGSKATDKGRKPILLELNRLAGSVLSLDISVDYLTLLVCDLKGTHCRLKQRPNASSGAAMLPLIKSLIQETIQELEDSAYGVIGISVGIHGVVHNNEVIFTPYYSLEDIRLADELTNCFHVPVYVENEANLSVLGERSFYFHYPNIINISVHSGIGLGILIDDKLYTGSNGYAGEFGHTIIIPDGRPCPCGNQGCIEQYASERALLLDFAQKKNRRRISIDEFMDYYRQGDRDAQATIADFVKYMGIGINNILNTLNPDLIVINSSFTMHIPSLPQMLQDSLKNRMDKYCRILPSGLQDTAILLGGACVVIQDFLGIKTLRLNPDSQH